MVSGTVFTDVSVACNKKESSIPKVHAAVDKHCRPIKLLLRAGNVNDIKVAPCLFLLLIENKGGSLFIPCKKTYKGESGDAF